MIYTVFILLTIIILIILIIYSLFIFEQEGLTNIFDEEYYKTVIDMSNTNYILNDPSNLPLTNYNTSFNSSYNYNNYDIKYNNNNNETDNKGMWVINPSNKMKYFKWIDISNYSTYFIPGAYPYGSANFVPSYEDTVYFKFNKNK